MDTNAFIKGFASGLEKASAYKPTPTQIQKAVAKHQSGKTMKGRPAVWARKALGLSNIGKKVQPKP